VVERHLRGLELEAVAVAPATPGADELIRVLARAGSTVTIVSNCSVSAVRAYLVVHDLAESARRISARTGPDLARLLPGPFFVEQAVEALGAFPRQCVMVCDSAAAIDAARAPTTPMPSSSTSPTCV
jgi:beta-phosphoglucomutase-like phosphatase (HAD superfamily)